VAAVAGGGQGGAAPSTGWQPAGMAMHLLRRLMQGEARLADFSFF
jgi:hypothetical protein